MPSREKQKGSRFERRMLQDARKLGLDARKQPLSGVLEDEYPNDLVIEDTLVECKSGYTYTTVKNGEVFHFPVSWLLKVTENARRFNRWGAVVFRPDGTTKAYVMLREEDFLQLLNSRKNP